MHAVNQLRPPRRGDLIGDTGSLLWASGRVRRDVIASRSACSLGCRCPSASVGSGSGWHPPTDSSGPRRTLRRERGHASMSTVVWCQLVLLAVRRMAWRRPEAGRGDGFAGSLLPRPAVLIDQDTAVGRPGRRLAESAAGIERHCLMDHCAGRPPRSALHCFTGLRRCPAIMLRGWGCN